MTKFKSIALIALAGVFLQSCSNDDDGPNNDPKMEIIRKGVFILNEGGFNSANAEITYFDPTKRCKYNKSYSRNFQDCERRCAIGFCRTKHVFQRKQSLYCS